MRDKKFAIGIGITLIWIGAGIWLAITQERPTKLNEWGDFIAGFSAPLAFFWLVLGYLQQGEELKNNTEALRLQAEELKHSTNALRMQAEELKNSVEQQSQLVAVNREQAELATQIQKEERKRRKLHVSPRFQIRHLSSRIPDQIQFHTLSIENTGTPVSAVQISVSPVGEAQPKSFEYFDKVQKHVFEMRRTDAKYSANFSYIDVDGNAGTATIPFFLTTAGVEAEPCAIAP